VGAHPAAERPLRPGLAPRLVHDSGRHAVPRGTAPPPDLAQTRRLGDARSGDIIVVQRFPPRCSPRSGGPGLRRHSISTSTSTRSYSTGC
jgi:hypothetical protein